MSSRVIVALDYADPKAMFDFVDRVTPDQCRLKVGKQLFTKAGTQAVSELVARGFDVFLDLKYHDIPNTVAGACEAARELGVWMVNIHAMGGSAMMKAASDVMQGDDAPILIAVTVLTSSGKEELEALGISSTPEQMVGSLSEMAFAAGLDGVVCSAREVAMIKQRTAADFVTVTPGIRPAGSDAQDQKRIMTPSDAVAQGADYLVLGRPVTQADDPCKVLRTINSEIGQS